MNGRNITSAFLAASLAALATIAGCRGEAVTGSSDLDSAIFASNLRALTGGLQTGPVAEALPQALSVRVVDAGGQPVAGAQVEWSVLTGGGTVNPALGTSNAQGAVATTWTLGTTLGENRVRAYLRRGYLLDSADFVATATFGSPAQLVLDTASAPPATAMVASTLGPIRIRVLDRFGYGVEGAPVAFAVPAGSGSVSTTTAISNAQGAVAVSWTLGELVGTRVLSASVGTIAPLNISVLTTPDTSRRMQVVSGNEQSVRQGLAAAPMVVRVTDRFGNMTGRDTVNWTILAGGGTVEPPRGLMDDIGIGSAVWTVGSTPGAGRMRAYLQRGTLRDSADFTLTILPGLPAAFSVDSATLPPATLPVTAQVTQVRYTVRDALGQPIPGVLVSFTAAGPGGPTVSTPNATTTATGVVAVNWRLGEATGAHSLTASVSGLTPITTTVTAIPDSSRRLVLVSGNGQVVRQGTDHAPLVVRTQDRFGNITVGDTVNWTIRSGGGVVDPPRSLSLANGTTATVWTAGPAPASGRVRAYLQRGTLRDSVDFVSTIEAGLPTSFAVDSATLPPRSRRVTTTTTGIRFRVRDALGLPVPNVPVTFTVTGPGGPTVAPATAQTNAAGEVLTSWTLGTGAGAHTLLATTGSLGTLAIDAVATADTSRRVVILRGNNQTVQVGRLHDTLLVRTQDQYGNPTFGDTLLWNIRSGGGSLNWPRSLSDTSTARAFVLWTAGTVPGPGRVRAYLQRGTLRDSVDFTSIIESSAAKLLKVDSTTIGGATARVRSTFNGVRFVLRDSLDIPVPNQLIVFQATGPGAPQLSRDSALTDANGAVTTNWTLGQLVGTQVLTASAQNIDIVGITVTATPDTSRRVVLLRGNNQSVPVGTLHDTLVVRTQDRFGNLTVGDTVQWTILAGGGSLNWPRSLSGGNSDAYVLWTAGPVPATGRVRAFLQRGTLRDSVDFVSSIGAGAVSGFTVDSATLPAATRPVATTANGIRFRVRDGLGLPVPNVSVTFTTTGPGTPSATPSAAVTNAQGEVQVNWTLGTGTGAHTLQATAGALPPIVINATATADTSRRIVLLRGNNQSVPVGTLLDTLVVRTQDRFGNLTVGDTVQWAILSGAGSLNWPRSLSGANSDAYVLWTAGPVPAAGRVRAYLQRGTLRDSVDFVASIGSGAATSFAVDSTTLPAATRPVATTASGIRFRIRDANNLPVPNATVIFTASGPGAPSASPSAAVTNAQGEVQVNWTLGTGTGTHSLLATSGALSPITLTATATPDTSRRVVLLRGNNQSVPVGTLHDTLVVRTEDRFGNLTVGDTLNWTILSGGGSLNWPRSLSGGNSEAFVRWTAGPVPAMGRVRAYLQRGTLRDSVDFVSTIGAGTPTSFAVDSTTLPAATRPVATTASGIRFRVRDANNLPVPNVTVIFTPTGAGAPSATPSAAVTNGLGEVQVNWTLGTVTGAHSLLATAGALPPITLTATATADTSRRIILVRGNNQSVPVGTLHDTLVVRTEDRFGNLTVGDTVQWNILSGAGSLNWPRSLSGGNSEAFVRWTAGPVPAAGRVRAYLQRGTLRDSVDFVSVIGSGTPTSFAVDSTTLPAATRPVATTASGIRFRVRDANNLPVPNATVTFTAAGPGAPSASPSAAVTNAQGEVQVNWTLGTGTGLQTLEATAGALPPITLSATATPDTSRRVVLLRGNNQSLPVGTLHDTLVVRTEDRFGNLTVGDTLQWNILSGGGSLNWPRSLSGTNSEAFVLWTAGPVPAAGRVRAYLQRGTLRDSVDFVSVIGSGTPTSFVVDSTTLPAATRPVATTASGIRFRVRDANNLPVPNATVTFTAAGPGAPSASPSAAVTNAQGEVQVNWTLGTLTGLHTLEATAGALPPITLSATATPDTSRRVVLLRGNTQSVPVGALLDTLGVRTEDRFGNLTVGDTVQWNIITGGGSLNWPRSLSGATSEAFVLWTAGPVPAAGRLRAYLQRGTLRDSVDFTATIGAGTPTSFVVDSTTLPSATRPVATTTSGIRYRVLDANNLPVPGIPVTFTPAGPGAPTASPAAPVTNALGEVLVNWTLGTLTGLHTLEAAVTALPTITLNATATPDTSRLLVPVSVAPDPAIAGSALPALRVRLVDRFGNRIAGEAVIFNDSLPTGMTVGPQQALTDVNGEATAIITLAQNLGVDTVRFRHDGSGGQYVRYELRSTMTFKRVFPGSSGMCGIGANDLSYCWGIGQDGQNGDGLLQTRGAPRRPVTSNDVEPNFAPSFLQTVGGRNHTCGVSVSRTVYCWGLEVDGRQFSIALPSDLERRAFASALGKSTQIQNAKLVTGGEAHTCALSLGGVLICSGNNERGQIGNGAATAFTLNFQVTGGGLGGIWSGAAAGERHTCAVDRQTANVLCWGANDAGQIGRSPGITITQTSPFVVERPLGFPTAFDSTSITAGSAHSCVLEAGTGARRAFCWGSNASGQLGNGLPSNSAEMSEVIGTFTQIYAAGSFTCGLAADGTARCWGRNDRGQLGNGSFTNSNTATPVQGGLTFVSLSLGDNTVCGTRFNGDVYCWGDNTFGQLGQGAPSGAAVTAPVRLSVLPPLP